MSAYTCITCHVAFGEPEHQREHYKTDWHRYNLKRKVVGMPPVTAATFQEKVKEHRVVETNKESDGIVGFSCKLCQKRFASHKAFENHKKSKKHRELENVHLEKIKQNISKEDLSQEKGGQSAVSQNVKKALADAKADMDKPRVIKSEDIQEQQREFLSGDNPRMRWFKKQAKALKDAQLLDEDNDEWEDIEDEFDEEDMEEDDTQLATGHAKDEDADMESLSSDAMAGMKQRLITATECIFCLKKSKNVESSVLHMSKQHGFFIPDIDYLVDLEGLLNYLGEKVGMGNICIWCNEKGKAFYSISAVLKHMKDKGHSNMLVTGDAALEYADFYDFGEMEYQDDTDEEMDSDNEDEEQIVTDDSQDLELVLPSGASIGHRSLMKYYKQKFPTVERHNTKKQRTLARLIAQYKAIGWHGSSASEISHSQKDLAYLQTLKTKYRLKLSVKNNKTQMKHFRSQI